MLKKNFKLKISFELDETLMFTQMAHNCWNNERLLAFARKLFSQSELEYLPYTFMHLWSTKPLTEIFNMRQQSMLVE